MVNRVAIALLMGLAPSAWGSDFAHSLPPGIPYFAKWEKSEAEVELDQLRLSVHYELYVSPARYGIYEIVRYRIQGPGLVGGDDFGNGAEKLQWDRGERDLLRFECTPPAAAAPGPCRWRELEKGSADYRREAWVTLWVYGLHRRLLFERDANR